jgi:hypothetical protein
MKKSCSQPGAGGYSEYGEGVFHAGWREERSLQRGCGTKIAILQDCCKAEAVKGIVQKTLLWLLMVFALTLVCVARLNYFDRDLWTAIRFSAVDFAVWVTSK